MIGMIQDILIKIKVGIDKCKNIVNIARYRRRVHRRAHAMIINNDDLARHILEHNWLGRMLQRIRMECSRHVFPGSLVGSDSQVTTVVLTDTRLTYKDGASSHPTCLLVKCVYHTTPLVSEEHLEDSQVYISNGMRENRRDFVGEMGHVRVNMLAEWWGSVSMASSATASSLATASEDASKTSRGTRSLPKSELRGVQIFVARTSFATLESEIRSGFCSSSRA